MELKEAIETLEGLIEPQSTLLGSFDKEAIKTVLEALEITQAKQEVAFEQGYRKGKDKGQQQGLQCGYGMGLKAKLKGEK
jgi:flagellar biosynthesis/type III secretory pathway protein FliH